MKDAFKIRGAGEATIKVGKGTPDTDGEKRDQKLQCECTLTVLLRRNNNINGFIEKNKRSTELHSIECY